MCCDWPVVTEQILVKVGENALPKTLIRNLNGAESAQTNIANVWRGDSLGIGAASCDSSLLETARLLVKNVTSSFPCVRRD